MNHDPVIKDVDNANSIPCTTTDLLCEIRQITSIACLRLHLQNGDSVFLYTSDGCFMSKDTRPNLCPRRAAVQTVYLQALTLSFRFVVCTKSDRYSVEKMW